MADDGQRQRHRARRARRVAAEQRDPEGGLIRRQPRGEGGEPGVRRRRRRRDRQQIAERLSSHRREIREVHAQQLARDAIGGVVRQVMHARHHGIRRHHQRTARRRREHGRIILEVERARPREGPEMAADEIEFGWQRGPGLCRRLRHG
jgi:hypothetical protein